MSSAGGGQVVVEGQSFPLNQMSSAGGGRVVIEGQSFPPNRPNNYSTRIQSAPSDFTPSTLMRPSPVQHHRRQFSVFRSTEENNKADDENFYGIFAHIRSTLDYSYHSNYAKERQFLQDSIIEEFLEDVSIEDVNGDVCTTPTEPWLVFTAGAMGAGKSHTIHELVKRGRFPLLAFVTVDPDEIRRRLPEFGLYAEKCPSLAGELTRKEAGYVAEVLTLAALQAGKNVLVDGSLRDSAWYQTYFARLRREYPTVKIAILHVVAPREAVFHRAAERAVKTGRVVPQETLEMALEQVPKSVKVLAPLADYFCELNNCPDAKDIEIVTDGQILEDIEIVTDGQSWDTFQSNWLQTCAWVPHQGKKRRHQKHLRGGQQRPNEKELIPASSRTAGASTEPVFTNGEKKQASLAAIRVAPPLKRAHTRSFSVQMSTEVNHKSDDMQFYGPYSHIRKQLDYTYHSNYKKERQWLQDAIIEDILKTAKLTDVNGDVCTTPTEPWLVFTAGAMGAGKSHTIRKLQEEGRFPLMAFVFVDPEDIRQRLPEFMMYVDQCATLAEEMTRKECGYIGEIIMLSALQAGKNVLVDGTLRDKDFYRQYIERLRKDFPHLRIAILHVVAPREAVLKRAEKRAVETGWVVPTDAIENTLEQVPISVSALTPLVDYVCELNNKDDIEIVTEGEDWASFASKWVQTCAFVPKLQRIEERKAFIPSFRAELARNSTS